MVALQMAGAFIGANPWRAACILLLLALGAQTVRLELSARSLAAEEAGHALTQRDLVQAGLNRAALRKGIMDQGAAIVALADAGERAKRQAAEAEKRAAEARGRTEALRNRLLEDARVTPAAPAPMTPAQVEAWKILG